MIYIQSRDINIYKNLPHHGDAASALYGTLDLGLDFRFISFERLMELKQAGTLKNLYQQYCFVGSTEFMQQVWETLGKTPKVPMNSDRIPYDKTLKEVREDINNHIPWFVKPYQLKLFSGLIIDKYSISSLKEFSDELHVMCYEPLPPILSEWRVYIHNHKMVDAKNYSGDFTISPNFDWVEAKIQKFRHEFPCAYTMDVGVLDEMDSRGEDHNQTIIEFNDFWAIGNYGIPNDLYVRMLRDRYYEIIKQQK